LQKNLEKTYFPNLNGIRFIAAFFVFIHHLEQFKYLYKIDNFWNDYPFIKLIGKLGVVLFFVLSGFLITYLLLAEEKLNSQINIKKFYIRRILRIWPLYFLILFSGLFIIPNLNFIVTPFFNQDIFNNDPFKIILIFIFFLPNLAYAIFGLIPYVSHTWSIGTEEQFYLIWPVLLKFTKNKLRIIVLVIIFYLTFKFLLYTNFLDFISFKNLILQFWLTFNIDCMAIGGLFSYLVFKKSKLLRYLMNKFSFYITLISLCFFLYFRLDFLFFHYEVYAILFGIIILNLSSNNSFSRILENNIFNFLGKISFGIYMYHPFAIILTINIFIYFNFINNLAILFLSLVITLVLSGFSFFYFEKFFLIKKNKYLVLKLTQNNTT
jgi:peptidoglycan/LPS O-acetylase OafA/YrhL